MNAPALLATLTALDVRLFVVDDRLRVNAPAGAIGPDLRADLAAHKAELLALLSTGPLETAVAPASSPAASWKPRPRPWLKILAGWPIPWRQRWGERANELAEAGVAFPEDERQAFTEVSAERNRPDA